RLMNRKQRRLAERAAADQQQHRAAINKQNAQSSTGPATAEGKETSKMNALKHGLTAQNPVLPTEKPADYESHKAMWLAELKPVTFTETRFAQIAIDTEWRLQRIRRIEDK